MLVRAPANAKRNYVEDAPIPMEPISSTAASLHAMRNILNNNKGLNAEDKLKLLAAARNIYRSLKSKDSDDALKTSSQHASQMPRIITPSGAAASGQNEDNGAPLIDLFDDSMPPPPPRVATSARKLFTRRQQQYDDNDNESNVEFDTEDDDDEVRRMAYADKLLSNKMTPSTAKNLVDYLKRAVIKSSPVRVSRRGRSGARGRPRGASSTSTKTRAPHPLELALRDTPMRAPSKNTKNTKRPRDESASTEDEAKRGAASGDGIIGVLRKNKIHTKKFMTLY